MGVPEVERVGVVEGVAGGVDGGEGVVLGERPLDRLGVGLALALAGGKSVPLAVAELLRLRVGVVLPLAPVVRLAV